MSYGQDFEVSGSIIDAQTKEPIPFSNIALKEIYKGTASNSLGEFSFKVDSLPIVLVITHLSYEPKEIRVTTTDPLNIELIPGKMIMDEVVINARGNSQYAYDLVFRAYKKISQQYSRSDYGKAFYRQISKNGDEYSELYEIFYDTRYSLNGIDDWAIQEGRYALKLSTADSFIYNKNFTLMARLLTIVQPQTEDLIMPVSEEVGNQYDLAVEQLLYVNNRKVAQIRFQKKDYIKFPAMEGIIFIDVDSYNVLKINGSIVNDKLKFITLKGENGSWKNYRVSCEIGFKPLEEDKIALEYINLSQNFDYYFDGVFTNKVETKSLLTYYEYYTPPKRKKLGGRLLRFGARDSDNLDNIGYNQSFWDENIIVKRTPIESEVIASFEAERAFGSIYLNNRNQIVLEDYAMDKDPFIIRVKEQLEEYELPQKGEKVYVHHDKPYYVAGENLWFKAYVVDMVSDMVSKSNGAFFAELISPEGKLIFSEMYPMNDGTSHGEIQIPDNLKSGEYILKAYPRWMKGANLNMEYQEKLEIYTTHEENELFRKIQSDSINTLTFSPEGGQLIESMPMQLGFMAKDPFDEGIEIRGRLVDEDGRTVSQIKSADDGYGSIFIMPRANHQYQTMVMSHEIADVAFPDVHGTGYSIMINTLKPNTIDVSVRGTMKLEGDKFYLLVISNGKLYDRRIGGLTRGLFKAEFPKSNLPNGISQILLTNEDGKILCKRLIFINQPEEVVAKYYLAKREFKARERIDMVIELKDENGKAVNGANFSVSVIDANKISRNINDQNIVSYLKLGYIADNHIPNPGVIFNDHDRETLKILDWIILNQNTVLPEIDSFDSLKTIEKAGISHENAWNLSGTVEAKNGGAPLSDGTLAIISYPNYSNGFLYLKTDKNGRFSIPGTLFTDSTRVLIRATDNLGKPTDVQINFDPVPPSEYFPKMKTAQTEISDTRRTYLDFHRNNSNEKILPTGKVRGVFDDRNIELKMYENADFSVVLNEKQARTADLMVLFNGRFPGLSVSGEGANAEISIRGERGGALILLDGIPLEDYALGLKDEDKINADTVEKSAPILLLSEIKPQDIERVDILKSAPALLAQFGAVAKYGVIVIYSKKSKNLSLAPSTNGFTELWLPGFASSNDFMSPDYSRQTLPRNNYDARTTLYWNPNVMTNRRGRAKIGFYNSDDARNLQICIEGVTNDGIPIFSTYEIGKGRGRIRVN